MDKKISITVVGDGYTGKTSMLIKYKDRKFNPNYTPTIFDSYSMTIPVAQEPYTVILQDTAGQEDFEKLRQLVYKDTDVFILCYSVDDFSSWQNVKEKWAPELKKCCPKAKLILAGTKCDVEKRRVSFNYGKMLSTEIKAAGFIENSAKLGCNIDDTICLAITSYINKEAKKGKDCVVM